MPRFYVVEPAFYFLILPLVYELAYNATLAGTA